MTNRLKVRLHRGDTVEVLSGRDRGKRGKITQVFTTLGMVVVDGINQRTRHLKSRRSNQPGQRLTFFAPLSSSKVALICPNCDKKTRFAYQQTKAEGETAAVKTRICRQCKQLV